MNIDFYNEIRYNLNIFNYILRKKKLEPSDIEQLIIILHEILNLLDFYLYDFLDY